MIKEKDKVLYKDNANYQSLLETKIFNDDWITYLNDNLIYINNIIKNPRTYIKENKKVVPVELARKTTAESVRYLATHAHHLQEVNEAGEIIPRKILATTQDVEIAIYENRFIKSLIDKLKLFLEQKYQAILALGKSHLLSNFHSASQFNYQDLNIEFALRLKVSQKIEFEKEKETTQKLLIKISKLLTYVNRFIDSPFYQQLKDADEVLSPIKITNILRKDPNYHKCYLLWVYLDKNYHLDYQSNFYCYNPEVDENKLNDTFFQALAAFYQEEIDFHNFQKLDKLPPERKKITIVPNIESEVQPLALDDYIINEYYYQQSRKVYARRIQEQIDNGKPYHLAYENVYRGALKITEQIFEDLIKVPDNIQNNPTAVLRFKIRNHKALEEIYKLKIKELIKMQRLQIKLLRDIEKSKLKLEKKKLRAETKQKSLLSISELDLEKERINKIISQAKNKLQQQRDKARSEFQKAKAIEKQQGKLKLQIERKKAREKIKIEKAKAKAMLTMKRQSLKAKYEARITSEKASLPEKLKKLKNDIREKTNIEIEKIKNETKKDIASIKQNTILEIENIKTSFGENK